MIEIMQRKKMSMPQLDPIEYLAQHWDCLTDTVKADKRSSILSFGDIVKLYTTDRAYHSLDHLVELFKQSETLTFDDPVSVGLAIFYHDAVYGASSRALLGLDNNASNEEQSAQLAEEQLRALNFSQSTIDRVTSLIRMTETHKADPADHDAALFLDMDMSILGAPAHIYERYAGQVRQEYMQYDAKTFCAGRLAFLTSTLASGKRLFLSNLYEERYGAQAKANMEAEKHHIEKTGTPYGLKTSVIPGSYGPTGP